MNIVGLDELVFGIEDMAGCTQFLLDYGLDEAATDGTHGRRFEALDGTAVTIADSHDSRLPALTLTTGCMLRKTVLGVADTAALAAVAANLAQDREVRHLPDGSIEAFDDSGFLLGFRVTVRRPLNLIGEVSNSPGSPIQRRANHLGAAMPERIRARTLSHIVYFVPDVVRAQAFYERLGFRVVDQFTGVGPFLQPSGTQDHHTHFLIGAPAVMQGVEHFTFHFGGPTEVITNGTRLRELGYQSFWGPGRHILGSNWFWYFNSPLACHIEMDADMDLHDVTWVPRELPMGADYAQYFLLQGREKWMPGPGSPEAGAYA